MKKIKSFTIDHDTHAPGFYFSNENHNIYTYDLRFKWPNKNDYLSTASAHTIEHLFATVVRNSSLADNVVYFGPMGCRTGFYLLLLGVEYDKAYTLTVDCFKKCLEMDSIPGCEKSECGNYQDHSLTEAKADMMEYLKTLQSK